MSRWHDAIRILAKLHKVSPSTVGLGDYGRSSGFYDRQLKTLAKVSASQAAAVDIETNQYVGNMPHFEDILAFLGHLDTQPTDRCSLVHGDFKIDNLVFHKTEPKVIGILE